MLLHVLPVRMNSAIGGCIGFYYSGKFRVKH